MEELWINDEMPMNLGALRANLIVSASDFDPRSNALKIHETEVNALIKWAFDYGFTVANELNRFDKEV